MLSASWTGSVSATTANIRVLHTLPPAPPSITSSFLIPTATVSTATVAVTDGLFSILTVPNSPVDPTAAMLSAMSATLISAGVTATATTTAIQEALVMSKGPKGHKNNGECRLLGPFALFVQGALGVLALLSLVWKRYRERPQRPLLIWWYDASKQVFGSVLVHIANLLMSMISAGQLSVENATIGTLTPEGIVVNKASDGYQPNPCSFYLINLAIDTTIGIGILIPLVRLLTRLARHTRLGKPHESVESGHYGQPPKVSWWLKQSIIYFMGLMGMKFCVLIMFQVLPWISRVGDWALRWTEGNERIQVAFVMLIFPTIMNGIQYYIIDGFIKDNKKEGALQVPDQDPDDAHAQGSQGLLSGYADGRSDHSDDDLSDDDDMKPVIDLADHESIATRRGAKEKHLSVDSKRPRELQTDEDISRSPGNSSGSSSTPRT